MLLARFTPPGAGSAVDGEVRDGQAVEFEGRSVLDLLVSEERQPATGRAWDLEDVTLHAPIENPRAIFCVGLNYQAHRDESRTAIPEVPDVPIIFLKLASSSTDPNGVVSVPRAVTQLDYEGELLAVIGADQQVGGYAIGNDLSARNFQLTEPQWMRSKAFDNSCPWGPWISTADGVADPYGLGLRTLVNGELRQEVVTGEMIFDIETVRACIAEVCHLHPGDIIMTGTPSGVGMARGDEYLLTPGDTVRVEIDGLGVIEHAIGEPH
jgi:acylpyruvate hydrolase